MTYEELIMASQDANTDPDRNEILARLVVSYVISNKMAMKNFDFKRYFLALEII